jgi:hypothetical protein
MEELVNGKVYEDAKKELADRIKKYKKGTKVTYKSMEDVGLGKAREVKNIPGIVEQGVSDVNNNDTKITVKKDDGHDNSNRAYIDLDPAKNDLETYELKVRGFFQNYGGKKTRRRTKRGGSEEGFKLELTEEQIKSLKNKYKKGTKVKYHETLIEREKKDNEGHVIPARWMECDEGIVLNGLNDELKLWVKNVTTGSDKNLDLKNETEEELGLEVIPTSFMNKFNFLRSNGGKKTRRRTKRGGKKIRRKTNKRRSRK